MLSIIITDYRKPSFNENWMLELDESLKLLDIDFDIIYVSDKQNYDFQSTKNVKRVFCESGQVWKSKQTGLDNADGEYVMFVDNDDKLLSGKISKYLSASDVVFPLYQDSIIRYMLNGVIFKKDLIKKYDLKFIPVTFSEDFYIVYNLFFVHDVVNCTNEPLYYYRSNNSSICHSISKSKKLECLEVVLEYMRNYSLSNMNTVNKIINSEIESLKKNEQISINN